MLRRWRKWQQCPFTAVLGDGWATCCTRTKGHDGQHHSVFTERAWTVA